jgi:DNA-binding response OmpR family regulator
MGDRHTDFLARRLGAMGLELEHCAAGETSISGHLPLTAVPFETLDEPLRAPLARFYTLGHSRLKFFEPRPFFRLPPIDVARCETREEIEAALRREWAAHRRRLEQARAWLADLGAAPGTSERGTRLELPLSGIQGVAAEVLSQQAFLLPSGGSLRDVRVLEPADRRHRPLRDLEHAVELELGISQAMDRLRERGASARLPRRSRASEPEQRMGRSIPPALLVLADPAELVLAESELRQRGLRVEAMQDPRRAMEALQTRSFSAALIDARLSRTDGVELGVRLGEAEGMEALPVLILDDRATERVREAARAAGAAGYVIRPIAWSQMAETLLNLVDHWSKRRFKRFESRLGLVVESDPSAPAEVAQEVSRGGMRLCSRREVAPGSLERYRIRLPPPHEPVLVEGEVVWRQAEPGSALVQAGIRFFQFLEGSESRWIELMASLRARRTATGRTA